MEASEHNPNGGVRFIVEDQDAKKRRYEVPRYQPGVDRPILALYMDSGSDNYAALAFAVHHMGLRLVPFCVIWHSWPKLWLLAWKQAGQWERVQEMLSVLNLHHGPWRSCAFWRAIQGPCGAASYLVAPGTVEVGRTGIVHFACVMSCSTKK
jgi:hypothetical protein